MSEFHPDQPHDAHILNHSKKFDEQEYKEFATSNIEDSLITPDHIYIDLNMLRDYSIGTLIAMIMAHPDAEQKYRYILDCLPKYRTRAFKVIAEYFPNLGFTDHQIAAFLEDSKNHNVIFQLSPITNFVEALYGNLLVNLNHSRVTQKKDDVTYYINTYPLNLNPTNCQIIKVFINLQFGSNCEVFYQDPKDLSLENLKKFDEIYTSHFDRLSKNLPFNQACTDILFLRKKIFSVGYAGDRTKPLNADKILDDLENYMKIITDFKLVKSELVTARYIKENVAPS